MPTSADATFVYDGDCAFCTACARFVERHIHTRARVLPWQFAGIDALGLTVAQCDEAVQWVAADGAITSGPDAIAELLCSAGPRWRVAGALLRRRVVRSVAWPLYRWVARNRHRMPGGTAACALPHEARRRRHAPPSDRPTAG